MLLVNFKWLINFFVKIKKKNLKKKMITFDNIIYKHYNLSEIVNVMKVVPSPPILYILNLVFQKLCFHDVDFATAEFRILHSLTYTHTQKGTDF